MENSQKILAKLVFQLSLFAPKLFTQGLYSTIMGVAIWEKDLWWLSLFCANAMGEQSKLLITCILLTLSCVFPVQCLKDFGSQSKQRTCIYIE